MALINKDALILIVRQRRATNEYIQKKVSCSPSSLGKWLDPSSDALPTIRQAKKLADCLHVPFAGLYMNPEDIPKKEIPSLKNLRTVFGHSSDDDSALNIATIDLLIERDFLEEISDEIGLHLQYHYLHSPSGSNVVAWAENIRSQFDIDLTLQYKFASSRKFYLYLRNQVESQGIFVQCFTGVPVESARGIAIFDKKMPIIGINSDDRYPGKSFSIIHELVHIFKNESVICNDMFATHTSSREEVFCNAVAGELLVPGKALDIIMREGNYAYPYSLECIASIAKRFSVSREVIARRLLDSSRIDETEYATLCDEFQRQLELEKEKQREEQKNRKSVGLPVSLKAVDRTSPSICKALYYAYMDESYSKKDIARHLDIDQKHVDRFLAEVSQWSR